MHVADVVWYEKANYLRFQNVCIALLLDSVFECDSNNYLCVRFFLLLLEFWTVFELKTYEDGFKTLIC